jgi:hypothetical protein
MSLDMTGSAASDVLNSILVPPPAAAVPPLRDEEGQTPPAVVDDPETARSILERLFGPPQHEYLEEYRAKFTPNPAAKTPVGCLSERDIVGCLHAINRGVREGTITVLHLKREATGKMESVLCLVIPSRLQPNMSSIATLATLITDSEENENVNLAAGGKQSPYAMPNPTDNPITYVLKEDVDEPVLVTPFFPDAIPPQPKESDAHES